MYALAFRPRALHAVLATVSLLLLFQTPLLDTPALAHAEATREPIDPAGTGRLHTISFNACDQYLENPGSVCYNDTPMARATYIKNMMNSWGAQAAAFQEMCRSTYDELLGQLGLSQVYGYFEHTVTVSIDRCVTGTSWGIAVITKQIISSRVEVHYPDDDDEQRLMLCGNSYSYSGFRTCSTHLSLNPSANQVNTAGDQMKAWALAGDATIVGGDFNIDNRASCSAANRMIPIYLGRFGQGVRACGPGSNYYYEVDNQTSFGDGTYDENTNAGTKKLDYTFMNSSRFYSDYGGDAIGTTISDHKYIRGAMTVHD